MIDVIFQAVRVLAIDAAAPYSTIESGSMPAEDGLCMYLGPGAPSQRYLDRGGLYDFSLVLNGKHRDQQVVLRAMGNIHAALSRRKDYPRGDGWEITSIGSAVLPNLIEREDSKTRQWLYGSILRVEFYMKGVK